jgi:hypothetical protein
VAPEIFLVGRIEGPVMAEGLGEALASAKPPAKPGSLRRLRPHRREAGERIML